MGDLYDFYKCTYSQGIDIPLKCDLNLAREELSESVNYIMRIVSCTAETGYPKAHIDGDNINLYIRNFIM